jgi:flagellar basal body-associated protein FliL
MAEKEDAEPRKRFKSQTIMILLIVAVSIVATGWALVTVSTTSNVPVSDFVTLPTAHLSTKGDQVKFVSISAIGQRGGVAVGVKGYLQTSSGSPVSGAKVYMTYYLRGDYRTQVATTDQNGYFEARFPMNWTGWLPITLTFFGDDQHQGLTQVFSVSGENL